LIAALRRLTRRIAPFVISSAALVYVFGWVIDWRSLPLAGNDANLPLFVFVTVLDKLGFFIGWTLIQWRIIVRFVEPLDFRELLAVKGGSELVRAVSPPLGDAAFLLGLSQLARNRVASLIAVALVPTVTHSVVLLFMSTLAFPFLEGDTGTNRDVFLGMVIGWGVFLAVWVARRYGVFRRMMQSAGLEDLSLRLTLRSFGPYLLAFVGLMAFDVLIQGMATRAFGVPIAWSALVARIPIFYLVLTIPSFGNFGTRELAWAELFSNYGSREELVAYSLWVNCIFLVANVLIGVCFLGRAIALVRDLRAEARRAREALAEEGEAAATDSASITE
jgi:hypothetical protein